MGCGSRGAATIDQRQASIGSMEAPIRTKVRFEGSIAEAEARWGDLEEHEDDDHAHSQHERSNRNKYGHHNPSHHKHEPKTRSYGDIVLGHQHGLFDSPDPESPSSPERRGEPGHYTHTQGMYHLGHLSMGCSLVANVLKTHCTVRTLSTQLLSLSRSLSRSLALSLSLSLIHTPKPSYIHF